VSEIKSGKMTLKLNTVDVSLIAEDVVAVQQVSAELKGLSLYLTTANLQHCRTDCQRIAQIITNLVSNAIRYTERGRVDVHLRMTSEGLQTALKIVVRDTGIGIAPEMQDGVFQPFMQVAKTRGGSGLGLAIVKGLVEQMGGTIGLESQLGSGSQFTVTLPVTVVIPAAAEPAPVPAKVPLDDIEHAVTAQEQTLAPGRGPAVKTSVLLVEDDMDIQETMADLLVSLGYHCETASSVEEALEYLPEANYSAIVLDMELANRSGLEVAVAARGFQSEHCVLIAVTAHAALLNQPGMEVFDARLSKPVDLDAVVAALNIKRLAPRI